MRYRRPDLNPDLNPAHLDSEKCSWKNSAGTLFIAAIRPSPALPAGFGSGSGFRIQGAGAQQPELRHACRRLRARMLAAWRGAQRCWEWCQGAALSTRGER